MRNRRSRGASAEGGRRARPLAIAGRGIVAVAVLGLLAFAIYGTFPGPFGESDAHATTEKDVSNARRIDWESYPESVVAWVEVPGTSIDEPIAQASADSPNHYLYNDATGQGAYGTPYVDCECSVDSPFVMVYGHHMSDGSVFADFTKFNDEAYALEHRLVHVYTRADNKRRDFEVIAVDIVNANYESLRTNFSSDEDRVGHLGKVAENCDLVLDEPATDCTIWAFATCSYQTSNSRTVVYAKLFGSIG